MLEALKSQLCVIAVIAFRIDAAGAGERRRAAIIAAREDRMAWIAYPKAGKLGTDLNRDILGAARRGVGRPAMRQVAIDEILVGPAPPSSSLSR